MLRVYMDNGATSFPKAPGVADAIYNYITKVGSSVNRGVYDSAFEAERIVLETRELLCELFNFNKPENVVFTKNITESLNVILKGFLKENDHVIVSSMEHNAVMRPLNTLVNKGLELTRIQANIKGQIDPLDVKKAIKSNTKAIIMTHASNVSGTMIDLESIGKIAKEANIFFIIDAAQTAGAFEVDFQKLGCNALAFTGHKSLLGPQGIGGFLIDDKLNACVSPLIEGGTGSASEKEEQPSYMPDKFESGTQNLVGIYGLNASLKYIKELGIEKISKHEIEITNYFLKKAKEIKNIRLVGLESAEGRTAVVSIDFKELDNAQIGFLLSHEFSISTRVGLHCAPSAHKSLNTYPQGSVRFSFSYSTTKEEVDYAIDSIKKAMQKAKEEF